MFAQVFDANGRRKHNHSEQPGERGGAHTYTVADRIIPAREQKNKEESQQGRKRDQPGQCCSRHRIAPTTSSN